MALEEILQDPETRILGPLLRAGALTTIEIGPATGTETEAVLAAQRLEGQAKIQLLGQERPEIDPCTVIVNARDHVVVDPIALPRRPIRCGRVEQIERKVEGKES